MWLTDMYNWVYSIYTFEILSNDRRNSVLINNNLLVYSDFDLAGVEHYVSSSTPLYELGTINSLIQNILHIDDKGECGLSFIESRQEITEVHIIDIEIHESMQSRGYGTILLKALIHIQKQLGIDKFYISGEIYGKDDVRKNIDFYNNFVKIYKELELEIVFYKSKRDRTIVKDIYASRWFEIYIK